MPNIVGKHIRPGAPLNKIAEDPNFHSTITIPPFGNYIEATADFDWDFVSIQPYFGSGSNLTSDVAFFQDIKTREPGATLVLYTGFPDIILNTYATNWESPLLPDGSGVPKTRLGRNYLDALSSELLTNNIDHKIAPIGAILKSVDEAAIGGSIPGISTVGFFYDPDKIHLNDEGDFIAYSTMFSTLFGELPSTVPFSHSLTSAQMAMINPIIQNATVPEPDAWLFGLVVLGMVAVYHITKSVRSNAYRRFGEKCTARASSETRHGPTGRLHTTRRSQPDSTSRQR